MATAVIPTLFPQDLVFCFPYRFSYWSHYGTAAPPSHDVKHMYTHTRVCACSPARSKLFLRRRQKDPFLDILFKGERDSKESAFNAGDPGEGSTQVQSLGKIPWRRKWQSTPGFLPGEPHGQRSLWGYSPWGPCESDTIEQLALSLFTLRGKNRLLQNNVCKMIPLQKNSNNSKTTAINQVK